MNRYEKEMSKTGKDKKNPLLMLARHTLGVLRATSPHEYAQHMRHARVWQSELARDLYRDIEAPLRGFPVGFPSNTEQITSPLVRLNRGGERLV